ncbi:flagellar hook-associated protein FlgL [Paenibacillus typhae]|uniref:Flagellar hook-associated protein 3 FlgL n=1 Tax=Paenibacillus typhae TaxID=1174501 RepID=A0A1G8NBN4_9BACL|nr:flagellar hook-associated protein FlgL [Paenibacillus typhae]SDI77674.1 flagellar hook-associated protein 3 FlgL [Paenibacillus typhae]
MLRVTSNMMNSQLLLNLNRNARTMNDTQLQLATGRKINKPSDDPVGITYSLRYRAELSSNEQYQENVTSALSWLEFNDTVMTQAGEVVQRLRELSVKGANGSNPQEALNSINEEVMQLKEQLVDIGNSQFNGKFIFNGQNYDIKPFDFTTGEDGNLDISGAALVTTDHGLVNYSVGDSVQLPINVTGNEVFGSSTVKEDGTIEPDQDNIFAVIDRISAALASGDTAAISSELSNLDDRINKMLAVQANIGAKVNRIELMENRLGDLEVNLTDLQSKTEDGDYAEMLMQSKIQENVYNASLSVGAKIIQSTLVDFIR